MSAPGQRPINIYTNLRIYLGKISGVILGPIFKLYQFLTVECGSQRGGAGNHGFIPANIVDLGGFLYQFRLFRGYLGFIWGIVIGGCGCCAGILGDGKFKNGSGMRVVGFWVPEITGKHLDNFGRDYE